MCGITGRIQFNPKSHIDPKLIEQMTDKIKYRGPDDHGIYVKDNVGLGFRRLSILDLSEDGHQPMSNQDGSVWIIFNGEIYNFMDLRDDLEKKGYTFKSKTDTETIIYLYEEYGEECVTYLRGMFAFAIWDDRKKRLFLARDRMGQKPLKYYLGKDFFVFGSELKTFLDTPGVLKEVDFEAVHHYLTLQYVPCPATGFKGIKKLPPAHTMTVDISKGEPLVTIKRYWGFDYSKKLDLSESEWADRILETLEESVRIQMIADVPLGAFLSGGVDSSAVVAMMAKHSKQPIKTFSIGFEEEDYNELPYARQIAEKFKTDHKEFIVKSDALKILPELIFHYEEPYADSSAIPTWYLSKLTREHVTVALNGDAGDENFAGYGMFPPHLFGQNIYRHVPEFIRKWVVIPGVRLFHQLRKNVFSSRLLRFAESFETRDDVRFLHFFDYFTPIEKKTIYTDTFKKALGDANTEDLYLDLANTAGSKNVLDRALQFMMKSYLPDDLLVKVDIATMAASLEGRSPLLDHHFVELTAQIPPRLKIKHHETKYIFKKALEKILPHNIIYRKKKGFRVPIEHWFRNELRDYTKDILLGEETHIHQWIKKEAIAAIIQEHIDTKINNANKIWALLTLELWYKNFFKT